MKYIAHFVKGLEEIGWKEIQNVISDAVLVEKKDKRIVFESNAHYVDLTSLKVADDIGIYFAGKIVHSIDDILILLKSIDIETINDVVGDQRYLSDLFSLTISESKSALLKNENTKLLLRKYIEDTFHLSYAETNHENIDFRIFIDGNYCVVSMRLTAKPLFHRDYRIFSQPGALKPTIAQAMIQVSGIKKGMQIVDLFCGSGTVLSEALIRGIQVCGGDSDDNSVQITKENLAIIEWGNSFRIRNELAEHTQWKDHYFDAVISNLPWDKQIKVSSLTALYEGTIKESLRILKKDGRLCLLVSNPELLVKIIRTYKKNVEISLYPIGFLGQNPTIVVI